MVDKQNKKNVKSAKNVKDINQVIIERQRKAELKRLLYNKKTAPHSSFTEEFFDNLNIV